jgi:alpha-tubulin suppressor-like RCC1 family protein
MYKRILFLVVAVVLMGGLLYWLLHGKIAPAGNSTTSVATPSPSSANVNAPANASAVVPLWASSMTVTGQPLDLKTNAARATNPPSRIADGRVAFLDTSGMRRLAELKPGDALVIPLPGNEELHGFITTVQLAPDGSVRVGGSLPTDKGSFSLGQTARGEVAGRILLRQKALGYLVSTPALGRLQLQEMSLADIMCYPMPREPIAPDRALRDSGPQASIPLLQSRPGATAVLYLDFDGATVNDPDWPAYAPDGVTVTGAVIVAPASALSSAEITAVWNRVKEDFAPFKINITTVESDYTSAAIGNRMRVIITPNDAASPGSGGVAYRDSFARAGSPNFNADVPAWVFNTSVNGVADAISHELGHTLGLQHDGRNPPLAGYSDASGAYYYGHGNVSSAVGWAPIMGEAYRQNLAQWSKGEYPGANNTEDDVAIISGTQPTPLTGAINNTGYVTDEAGDSRGTAATLSVSGNSISQTGIISSASDVDFYEFTLVSAQVLTLRSNPPEAYAKQANLDIGLELQDLNGNVLAYSNPDGSLSSSLNTTLSAGTYYVKVIGAGRAGGGNDYGYSSYGSIGAYSLTGTFAPYSGRPLTKRLAAGQSVVFDATALGSGTLNYVWKHNGIVVPGATGPTFPVNNASAADRGRYEVIAADANSSTLSVFYLHVAVDSAALIAWGRNDYGQTAVPSNLGSVAVVRAGRTYGVAVKADGTLARWGTTAPALPSDLTQVVDVAIGGGGQAFALLENGTVVGWGAGESGQLAIPTGLTDVVALSSNMYHTIALLANGTVATWGPTNSFQGPTPSGLTNIVAVAAASEYFMALKADGTVVEWGQGNSGSIAQPASLNDVVDIAAGDQFSTALRASGAVVSWRNPSGTIPVDLANPIALANGAGHNLALKGDGTVVAWGYNGYGETQVPPNLTGVISVTGGLNYSVALVSNAVGLPVITSHPISQVLSLGDEVIFSISVTGTGLSYQWRKDGAVLANGGNVSGATTSSLRVTNLGAGNAGAYSVVVSNSSGSVVSTVTLKVVDVPAITVRPLSRTAMEGQAVTLTTVVSGAGLSYQWKRNGVVISGANDRVLTIPSLTLADRGRYEMIATNSAGKTARTIMMLYVWSPNSWVVGWGDNGGGQSTVPSELGAAVGVVQGGNHALAVKPDGSVVGWGSNPYGQAVAPVGLGNVVAVAAGSQHSVALKTDGTVAAWGNNDYGQTNVPAGLANVVVIAASAGGGQSLALRADGTVVAWGKNDVGQANVPAGLVNVVAIDASGGLSMALKADGTVSTWGSNGGYVPPSNAAGIIDAALGDSHGLFLQQDGSVTAWGYNGYGQRTVPAGLTDVRAVAAGSNYSLALKTDGTVVTWGLSANLPPGLVGVVDISAGANSNLALVSNNLAPVFSQLPQNQSVLSGTNASFVVSATGGAPLNYQWQRSAAGAGNWADLSNGGAYSGVDSAQLLVNPVGSAMDGDQFRCVASNPGGPTITPASTLTVLTTAAFTSASAGYSSTLFVLGNGSLYGMGSNSTGQLGVPTLLGNTTGPTSPVLIATGVAKAIATRGFHSLFIKTDGTLWAMGLNNSGQLGDGTTTNRTAPIQIATQVAAASGGESHTLFLKTNGTLWAMGANGSGQLGTGNIIQQNTPVQIATGVAQISAGGQHSLFLKTDGTLWAMGTNNEGQLGDGTQTNRTTPVQISTGVATIGAGNYHSLFIKNDGTLWAMGANSTGQLGDGTTTRRLAPIQVATGVTAVTASSHTLFIKTNGSLWGMGYNFNSQLGVGSGSSQLSPIQVAAGILAVSAGGTHSVFLKTDGTLLLAGNNQYGQLGTGDTNNRGSPYPLPPPATVITTHPASQTRSAGQSVTFNVTATGIGPLTYQWRKNAVDISGATSSSLTLSNLVAGDAGNYDVVLTDSHGSTTSTAATLTVNKLTPALSWSAPAAILQGTALGGAQLNASANVAGTFAYTPASGTLLPLGRHPLTVTFTPSESTTYNSATLQQDIIIYRPGTGVPFDFDGDGQPDVLFENMVTAQVGVWTMTGTTPTGWAVLPTVTTQWQIKAVADFNGDGHPDILFENMVTAQVGIWSMTSITPTGWVVLPTVTTQWQIKAAADFNGDGQVDILFENTETAQVGIWTMTGTTPTGWVVLPTVTTQWQIKAAADFNGDGQVDILFENTETAQVGIWTMSGTTPTGWVVLPTVTTQWQIQTASDFNGDGHPDILFQNMATAQIGIWTMTGTTPTGWVVLPTVTTEWHVVNH